MREPSLLRNERFAEENKKDTRDLDGDAPVQRSTHTSAKQHCDAAPIAIAQQCELELARNAQDHLACNT